MFTYTDIPHRKSRLDTRARQRSEAKRKPGPQPTKHRQSPSRCGMTFGQARSAYGAVKPKPATPTVSGVTTVRSDTDWSATGGDGYEQLAALRWPPIITQPIVVPQPTTPLLLAAPRVRGRKPSPPIETIWLPAPASTVPAFDRVAAATPLAAAARTKEQQVAFDRAVALSNNGHDKSYNPAQVTKEDVMLYKISLSADCLQHESPVAPAPIVSDPVPARYWAGRSDTPGLPETIDTKRSAEILAAARKANSPYLTDPARVRRGAVAV